MSDTVADFLWIERGPERGRRIDVAPEGVRIGRSSNNDIVLNDPSLSRFHCRIYHDSEGRLVVADLGSTNKTLCNGMPLQDNPLQPGDRISIGDTQMLVCAAGEAPPSADNIAGQEDTDASAAFDLGLKRETAVGRVRWGRLLWIGVVLLAIVGMAFIFSMRITTTGTETTQAEPFGPSDIWLEYEKVEGGPSNIFRYAATLEDGVLSVRIDDLSDGRHGAREKSVDPNVLQRLAGDLQRSGFFNLQSEYRGMVPDSIDSWDLAITLGRRTHRSRVINRIEPDTFREVRQQVEEFVRNEMGLSALALPPDQLRELARDAFLRGRKLYDERAVRHGNLFAAIKAFEEVLWYCETLEPKPDFYPRAVHAREESRRLLQERYEQRLFQAERAVKLRSWREAAEHLRIIADMIPERSDDRHQRAWNMLLDVERRIGR